MKENIEIRKILLKLGISANMKGFNYIIQSINFIHKQSIHTSMLTVYGELAKNNDVTTSSIERAIRQAIIKSYSNNKVIQQIYGKKPQNAQFLYDLVFNLDIFVNVIYKED